MRGNLCPSAPQKGTEPAELRACIEPPEPRCSSPSRSRPSPAASPSGRPPHRPPPHRARLRRPRRRAATSTGSCRHRPTRRSSASTPRSSGSSAPRPYGHRPSDPVPYANRRLPPYGDQGRMPYEDRAPSPVRTPAPYNRTRRNLRHSRRWMCARSASSTAAGRPTARRRRSAGTPTEGEPATAQELQSPSFSPIRRTAARIPSPYGSSPRAPSDSWAESRCPRASSSRPSFW